MNKEHYRFKIGTFACTVVMDGTHTYLDPVQKWFVNAPKERLKQVLRDHGLTLQQWHKYVSPYPSLVIETEKHKVLVDTGAGNLGPTTGKLIPNLQAAGIVPQDIDLVILTHAHPDHIGGNLDSKGRLTFPNARYVMWKKEWEFWTSEPDLRHIQIDERTKQLIITCACRNLPPLKGRLELVDRETEIVPGIRAVAAPGHTPGHTAVAVSSEGEDLLCIVDAAILPIHLEQPDWYIVNDFATDQALASRRRLLEMAGAKRALVHGFHFPFPGLGHVIQQGAGWQWQPIKPTG